MPDQRPPYLRYVNVGFWIDCQLGGVDAMRWHALRAQGGAD